MALSIPRERWATFSVKDHMDTRALVADLMMYDRLVFPVPEDDTRRNWDRNNWDFPLLEKRMKQLGDLAIPIAWNLHTAELCKDLMERRNLVQREVDPYHATRLLLKEQIPSGSLDVTKTVVAGFRSERDLASQYLFEAAPDTAEVSNETLALVLVQRLAVPANEDADKALEQAIELAHDETFRQHRLDLYDWQDEVIKRGLSRKHVIEDLDEKIAKYNEHVSRATKTVYLKYAFTVASAALTIARAAVGDHLALAAGVLAIAQFATLDRKPVLQPDRNGPAAMFHDVESCLYKKLRWA